MGQVEQPRARFVQAREGRHPRHCPLQQVLLRRGRDQRAGQDVLQGCQQAPERAAMGAVPKSSRGLQGHGDQPGLPHAQRRHVHVRAAQARSERVLRQALGITRRHPHGADRVSPVNHTQLNTGQPPHTPTMGRGRSGGTTSSMRALTRHPKRYVLNMRWGLNVSNPPAVTPYQAVLPPTPHEQTRALVHRTGSKPREHPAS